jgi:hypothetical protein
MERRAYWAPEPITAFAVIVASQDKPDGAWIFEKNLQNTARGCTSEDASAKVMIEK